jgi:hypothetical protein
MPWILLANSKNAPEVGKEQHPPSFTGWLLVVLTELTVDHEPFTTSFQRMARAADHVGGCPECGRSHQNVERSRTACTVVPFEDRSILNPSF